MINSDSAPPSSPIYGGILTAGLALAVGGGHPQVGGARIKEDQEILWWCPNADLSKVVGLQRKVYHSH